MRDQPSDNEPPLSDDEIERTILTLLLESNAPGQWSVEELAREVGGELRAIDAIVRLHAAGLVHRCHEFVWATRAAVRSHQLELTA